MLDWRCSLPPDKVAKLRGSAEGWDCRDLGFEVIRVGFDQMPDAETRARLDAIPTRFKLPEADIDLLLSSSSIILRNHPGYRRFVESFGR
jgi:NTE family protein